MLNFAINFPFIVLLFLFYVRFAFIHKLHIYEHHYSQSKIVDCTENSKKTNEETTYQQTMDFVRYFLQLDRENAVRIQLLDWLVVVQTMFLRPVCK